MGLVFEWDDRKARENVRKHGVSLEEAATVFADPLSLTIPDRVHGKGEERFITVGASISGRLIVVVHTDRDNNLRLTSASGATKQEGKDYEER
jgi:uncharacterized DUF497 family protein